MGTCELPTGVDASLHEARAGLRLAILIRIHLASSILLCRLRDMGYNPAESLEGRGAVGELAVAPTAAESEVRTSHDLSPS